MATFLSRTDGFTPVIDVLAQEMGLVTAVVYGVVWRYCQQRNGVCYASVETIASHVGINPKTVRRHIKTLCEHGYLEDLTPNATNRPHTYADSGKAKIIGLVEAKVVQSESPSRLDRESYQDNLGRTESPSGGTESPSRLDRKSKPPGQKVQQREYKESKKKDKEETWSLLLAEIRPQMTKATFNKWVAPCSLISVAGNGEGVEVRIRCQNAFARDWLTNRLQPIFIRALEGLLGKSVTAVSFEPVVEGGLVAR